MTGVEVSSSPTSEDTYLLGETIQVTLTFSEKVTVTGAPRLRIDMDPAHWGEKPASYAGGSGTTGITFTHTVVEPNYSTRGIAVLANSLELNGGTIRSSSTQADADLFHIRLEHNADHKVDWQRARPNRAPAVNTDAENYDRFTGDNNAPRGVLVSKPFYQVFTDPDGDELTYSVAITAGDSSLVEELVVTLDKDFQPDTRGWPPIGTYDRVFFQAEGESDWKAITPPLPHRPVVTVTLTATDPDGLSASVNGDFVLHWETYPEVVSAVGSESAIELTFDMEVLDDPAPLPEQFTVKVVRADGSSGTVEVSGVSVSGAVVTLGLAAELVSGQTVKVDYAYLYHTPLRAADGWGDPAPWFYGQAVDMSQLNPPEPPQNFAVSVRRGQLALSATWDTAEGATSYKLRWRKAGEEFTAANSATVSDTSAAITVSGYGEWEVRLQACNDNGCAPVDGGSEDETPAVRLSIEPAQDVASQAQPRARSATATRDPATDENSYTAGWGPAGEDSQAQSQSQQEADRQTRGIDGPSGAAVPMSSDQTDTTPPRLVRGEIDGDTMTFYFSEALDESATGSRFRVTLYIPYGWVNFTAHPSRVEVSGNKVTVHGLSRDGWPGYERAVVGRPVQAYYYKNDQTVPAGHRLRDLAGNEVLTPHRSPGGHFPATRTIWVRNLTTTATPTPEPTATPTPESTDTPTPEPTAIPTPDPTATPTPDPTATPTPEPTATPTPPALQSAEAHPRWLTLTFDKSLHENSVPAASVFTVTVNGSAVSLAAADPVAVSGDTVTLVLASPVTSTDAVTVSYDKPSSNPLQGPDGAPPSFSGQAVTNLVGMVPSVSQVAITSTPSDGEAYAANETVQVSLTFTEAVVVDTTGGVPRLRIKLAPTYGEKWADYSGGSGTATLTFGYTVAEPDRSTSGMAVLRDRLELNGGTIRSVTTPQTEAHRWHGGLDHDANHRVGRKIPALLGVVVSGTKVSVSFEEALDADSVPPASAFTVKRTPQGGSEETVSLSGAPVIAGGSVLLTLANAVAATDTDVKVSYAKPTAAGASKLKYASGNEVPSFTVWAAEATDTTPPRPVRGTIDGGDITIYFSEPLDETYETYGPPNEYQSHFRVKMTYGRFPGIPPKYLQCKRWGGITHNFRATPKEVIIDGNRATLIEMGHGYGHERLRARVGERDPYVYFLVYRGTSKIVRDLAGNVVSDARATLDNVTRLPHPKGATVNGKKLTLTFSAPMDGGRVPAASAFTVKVNGSVVSLASANPVSVSSREVTLTLAAAVASADTVTVSYEIPGSNWLLQNVVCEYAPGFTDQVVTNSTP